MSFEELQDGRHGGHLGYRNKTFLAILNSYVAPVPPIKFQLNPQLGVRAEMSFEEFQNGHRGYNRMILAIQNLHVATLPPTKFQLNPTYGSGGDVKNVKS